MSAFEGTPWEAIGGTVRTAYDMGNRDKAGVEVVTVPAFYGPTEAHKIALLIAADTIDALAEALGDFLRALDNGFAPDKHRVERARAALAKAGLA